MDTLRRALLLSLLAAIGAGCGGEVIPSPDTGGAAAAVCADRNPLRNLYFGDLHVHTQYSFDAYIWDTRTTPSQAYRFARGEPLLLTPHDASGNGTRQVRLDRPLDFTAVTDHSEFLAEIEICTTPGSPTYDSVTCRQVRTGNSLVYASLGSQMATLRPKRLSDVCGADGALCTAAMMPVTGTRCIGSSAASSATTNWSRPTGPREARIASSSGPTTSTSTP